MDALKTLNLEFATRGYPKMEIGIGINRKVKWQFEMNRLEPITVKNVSHPVQVYEVTGYKLDAVRPA